MSNFSKALIILLSIAFMLSCSKDDYKQDCGQEIIAEYYITNYSDFSKFDTLVKVGDVKYSSNYRYYDSHTPWPSIIYWGMQLQLSHICNSDTAHIEFKVLLHNPDSLIIPTGSVWEELPVDSTGPLFTLDRTFFQRNTDYDFHINYGGKSGIINAFLYFNVPSKGSFSADSAYFFSNLDYMSCKITAHKPQ